MDTRAGKLPKHGPIVSLSGASFGPADKLLYNGKQFIKFTPRIPKAVEASARSVLYVTDDGIVDGNIYASFRNSDGEFRFIDGNPTYTGEYTGTPTDDYHYVVIGYDTPVTTDTILFWAEEYVPVGLVRIDYSYDGVTFYTVPTHVGNVSYEFDDTIKIYSTESSPAGQYKYTVDLGSTYTARYWRIRSFLYSYNTSAVSDVNGKDVTLTTTSGLPSSSTSYLLGDFYYNSKVASYGLKEHTTTYTDVSYDGTKYTLSNVKFVPGSDLGTVYAAGATISLEEYLYTTKKVLVCDEDSCGSFICRYGSPDTYPDCFSYEVYTKLDGTNILYQSKSYSSLTLSSSPQYVDMDVVDFMPSYDSTATGPNGGELVTTLKYVVGERVKAGATYTSITGNDINSVTINGWADTDDLSAGNYFLYLYPMKLTQVRVFEKQGPQFTFWESDGDVSVSNILSVSNVYDVAYDTADNVFYVIGFSENAGTGTPSVQDDFSAGVGSHFDTDKWYSSGNGFYRDTYDDALVFLNTSSGTYAYGSLESKSYFSSDYEVSLSTTVDTTTSGGFFGLFSVDKEENNELVYSVVYGDWGSTSSASLHGGVVSSIENYTDGVISIRNLKFDPTSLPTGTYKHKFTYTSSTWYYTRTNITSPGSNEVSSTDVGVGPFINTHGVSVMLDSGGRDINSGSFVEIITSFGSVTGVSSRSLTLSNSYVSSSGFAYSYFDDGTEQTIIASTVDYASTGMKIDIRGDTTNFVTVSSTGVTSTGSTSMDVPCLYVSVINEEGSLTTVSGVSDAGGNVITYLDLIADPAYTYDSLYGKVSIATTHETAAAGGSVFIRVGQDLYKYNKAVLPLTTNEDGSSAVASVKSVFPSDYIYGFMYDDYVVGGLSYLYHDQDIDEVHLNVISDSTLEHATESAWLDLSNVNAPYARDVNDLSVIYTVDGSDVYVFNADENSVAFCNIVSQDPILPASSDYSTTITARVVNMFGQPLSNKRVSFVITNGGGSLSAATACSTSSGTASVTFTSSSVQGTSSIMATASDDTC